MAFICNRKGKFDRVLEELHVDTAFEGGVCGRTNKVARDRGDGDRTRCCHSDVLRQRGVEGLLGGHLEQVAVAPIGGCMGDHTSAHLGLRVFSSAAGDTGTSDSRVDPGKQSFG
jgi:hypothetical protein